MESDLGRRIILSYAPRLTTAPSSAGSSLGGAAVRQMASSSQEERQRRDDPSLVEGEARNPRKEMELENEEGDLEEEEEEEEDGEHVNEETGEVGGPRGPEPTRFGYRERNGRGSNF